MDKSRIYRVWVAAALLAALPSISRAAEAVPLHEAMTNGQVWINVTSLGGASGDTLLVTARRLVPRPLRVWLAPGTVFTSRSGNSQNMTGAAFKGERVGDHAYRPEAEMLLQDDAEHAYVVEAYCLDFHKDNPRAGESFSVTKPDARVGRLLSSGRRSSVSFPVLQSALWMEREKISEAEVRQRLPVRVEELRAARELLDNFRRNQPALPEQPEARRPTPAAQPCPSFIRCSHREQPAARPTGPGAENLGGDNPAAAPLLNEVNFAFHSSSPVESNGKACTALMVSVVPAAAITTGLCARYFELPIYTVLRVGIRMPFAAFTRVI